MARESRSSPATDRCGPREPPVPPQRRDMRSAGVRAYEDRLGPLRGYRGVYAHLDPVELPSGLVPGTPEIVSERDLRLGRLRGANVDYPDVYRQACAAWGEAPDPKVLAFSETYEGTRADLKNVTGSA